MHTFLRHAYVVLAHFGGFGVLALSFIDSSPLFLPFGNDLFLIAMTARSHHLLFYYALMSATGSVLGCLVVDVLSRKSGEKGFEKTVPRRRFNYIKRKVTKNAAWALVFASLMPPPFPYTGFVAGTAAFQYPRKRLMSVVFLSRFVRFSIEGLLAILFSQRLLRLARSSTLFYAVIALMVISLAISGLVIWRWAKASRTSAR
jgi:membrane protein YqaA with SNARE-associated domain